MTDDDRDALTAELRASIFAVESTRVDELRGHIVTGTDLANRLAALYRAQARLCRAGDIAGLHESITGSRPLALVDVLVARRAVPGYQRTPADDDLSQALDELLVAAERLLFDWMMRDAFLTDESDPEAAP